jgi:serine/threonine protein kinase
MRFKSRGNIMSPESASSSPIAAVPDEIMQEINIMKFLQHPHLVTLYEIIDDDDSTNLYLVMEYMEGGPIMTFNQSTQLFVSRSTNSVLLESMARRAFR